MNKFFTVLLILLTFACSAQAQDLIVYVEGDSLNCTVISQNAQSVHFFYTDDDEVVTRELSKDLFKSIVIGFYRNKPGSDAVASKPAGRAGHSHATINESTDQIETDTTRADVISTQKQRSEPQDNMDAEAALPVAVISVHVGDVPEIFKDTSAMASKWAFGFRGGYANRLFRLGNRYNPVMKEYIKELKSGYDIGADLTYFVWKNVGLGLNADLYKSVARMRDDSRQDAISIKYIGPAIVHRKELTNTKSTVFTGFTMGYQAFTNYGKEGGKPFISKAKAIGWGANAGLAYKISPHAALNFTASCLIGTFYEFSKEEGNKKQTIKLSKDSFEDLSRISLTIGLKFL